MRFDIYLPLLRKPKRGAAPPADGLLRSLLCRVLPAGWLSDRAAGKPGRIRRALKALGPTVASSPFRRLVQALCFAAFLVLFFYVGWPYTAQPQPNPASSGWVTRELDLNTGRVTLASTGSGAAPAAGERVHLVDADALTPTDGYIAPYRAVAAEEGAAVTLQPEAPLDAEAVDRLLEASGEWLLFRRHPWPAHYAEDLAAKERIPAEIFLLLDPLVALSTALAGREWIAALAFAAGILLVCLAIPRGFCGYLCPLGTLIDLFDWAIAARVKRFRLAGDGWWVHLKYYLLAAVLAASAFGVLLSGYVAAIPVVTRGLMFTLAPFQVGLLRGWHQVPPIHGGHLLSLALFAGVLLLGLLAPRFWCKYLCPSGAVFSLGNLLRLSERKVAPSCIHCNKCVAVCPFDAIKPDFTTRVNDCTWCQTCGGVCPTQAIKFVPRLDRADLKPAGDVPTGETALGRRGFLSWTAGIVAAVNGAAGFAIAARASGRAAPPPVRPPGSVPEPLFLALCIRCEECLKFCPNHVLQPMGFSAGLDCLWTPEVVADWAGCESSCNACGQVCPTGAIRPLPLEEKRAARMGLAVVDPQTCLPLAGRDDCQLCLDECNAAGYYAIEQRRVGTQVDAAGRPIDDSGFLAPVVLADRCVGCGLCQTRCHTILVAKRGVLHRAAIVVEAGEGKEDRLARGSYRELRRAEARQRPAAASRHAEPTPYLLPEDAPPGGSDSPFGVPGDDSPFGTPGDDNPLGL